MLHSKAVEGLSTIYWNGIGMTFCQIGLFSSICLLTSVSKKPGQTTVVIRYHSLSRFVWKRRYMVESSLHINKLRLLMIHNRWKTEIWFFSITEPCRDNLKPWFLIKSGYYIVPSPSTALLHRVFLRSITSLLDPSGIGSPVVTKSLSRMKWLW